MYKRPSSGLRGRILPLLLPDVSPTSVAGILRELAPLLLFGVYWTQNKSIGASPLKMPATDVGVTSGKRSDRPRSLSPEDDFLYNPIFL